MQTTRFRSRSARALADMHYGPNMTPMVDVVMVILVFFMASAAILGPEWFVPTRLPRESARAADESNPPLRVALGLRADDAGSRVTLDGREVGGLADAEAALRGVTQGRETGNVVILISADARVAYEDVVRLHALCLRLGFTKVGLTE